ncbi:MULTISPECIES: hypothetical protein [unclassified Caballeronia]|uniref:hypothetical protein n=1 Tax=unclassified Caballeronia TaxID=2646786 RepID=UPI002027FD04|nr:MULTISPECIES: hypothetical protein [unclassified Caballeronia]
MRTQPDALVRLEKINQKTDEARAEAQKIMAERRDEQPKARTRELIELGGIISIVEFPVDRGTLAALPVGARPDEDSRHADQGT